MNYKSLADISNDIRNNLYKVPRETELVVGIPRSGMLAASNIAMNLNINFCDINTLILDTELHHGQTRNIKHAHIRRPSNAKHILIVDDSIDSGSSLAKIKAMISSAKIEQRITYGAIYATNTGAEKVDLYFEIVAQPRIFEWNIMHRELLSECCVDIDGVLCLDPTREENDDGGRYINFLKNAKPLVIPSYPIGHLVTSRLEKYRIETEYWLDKQGVRYNHLHMLDLPDAITRQKLGCHAEFKASTFKKLKDTLLFIESEPLQAQQIAQLSGKHALSFSTQEMYKPGITYASVKNKHYLLSKRILAKSKRIVKAIIKT